jgi:hypothetical protein
MRIFFLSIMCSGVNRTNYLEIKIIWIIIKDFGFIE